MPKMVTYAIDVPNRPAARVARTVRVRRIPRTDDMAAMVDDLKRVGAIPDETPQERYWRAMAAMVENQRAVSAAYLAAQDTIDAVARQIRAMFCLPLYQEFWQAIERGDTDAVALRPETRSIVPVPK